MIRTANEAAVRVRASYTYAGFGYGSNQTTFSLANTNVYIGGSYTYAGSEYVSQQHTRVAIDPNVRVRGNDTYAGFEDVTGPIAVGEVVDVYEPESGVAGEGRVTEIDGDRELVYLSVDWSSLTVEHSPRHESTAPVTQALFIAAGPLPATGVDDDWMRLIARPCLANVGWADTAFWVTAPAVTASFDSLLPCSAAPHLEIWQLRVSSSNVFGVAA